MQSNFTIKTIPAINLLYHYLKKDNLCSQIAFSIFTRKTTLNLKKDNLCSQIAPHRQPMQSIFTRKTINPCIQILSHEGQLYHYLKKDNLCSQIAFSIFTRKTTLNLKKDNLCSQIASHRQPMQSIFTRKTINPCNQILSHEGQLLQSDCFTQTTHAVNFHKKDNPCPLQSNSLNIITIITIIFTRKKSLCCQDNHCSQIAKLIISKDNFNTQSFSRNYHWIYHFFFQILSSNSPQHISLRAVLVTKKMIVSKGWYLTLF